MIIKGFKFGMLLQIAIGPVCMYIIKTANESGILAAEAGVLAATAADILFVILAIAGVGTVLERKSVKAVMKYFGAAVLIYFGAGIILGAAGITIIPSFNGSDSLGQVSNAFATSFVLTAANPLSILFWTGVFASRLSDDGFSRPKMIAYGAGAVMATPVFLGLVALAAGILHFYINRNVINVMNILVGIVLIGFAVRMLLRRTQPAQNI